MKKIIDDLKSKPVDPEQLALLHNVNENRVSGHMSRGFVILGKFNYSPTLPQIFWYRIVAIVFHIIDIYDNM